MKICKKCNKKQSITLYHRHKITRDGLSTICKACESIRKKNIKRTKIGLIAIIYTNQKHSSVLRGHPLPSYTREEFLMWLLNEKQFNKLYNLWVDSDFNKDLMPSIDRLNDFNPYSFDNIQIVTWRENYMKSATNRLLGISKEGAVYCKRVNKYDIKHNFLCSYHSAKEAERQTKIPNSNISATCLGKRKTAGGFVWKHLQP